MFEMVNLHPGAILPPGHLPAAYEYLHRPQEQHGQDQALQDPAGRKCDGQRWSGRAQQGIPRGQLSGCENRFVPGRLPFLGVVDHDGRSDIDRQTGLIFIAQDPAVSAFRGPRQGEVILTRGSLGDGIGPHRAFRVDDGKRHGHIAPKRTTVRPDLG